MVLLPDIETARAAISCRHGEGGWCILALWWVAEAIFVAGGARTAPMALWPVALLGTVRICDRPPLSMADALAVSGPSGAPWGGPGRRVA